MTAEVDNEVSDELKDMAEELHEEGDLKEMVPAETEPDDSDLPTDPDVDGELPVDDKVAMMSSEDKETIAEAVAPLKPIYTSRCKSDNLVIKTGSIGQSGLIAICDNTDKPMYSLTVSDNDKNVGIIINNAVDSKINKKLICTATVYSPGQESGLVVFYDYEDLAKEGGTLRLAPLTISDDTLVREARHITMDETEEVSTLICSGLNRNAEGVVDHCSILIKIDLKDDTQVKPLVINEMNAVFMNQFITNGKLIVSGVAIDKETQLGLVAVIDVETFKVLNSVIYSFPGIDKTTIVVTHVEPTNEVQYGATIIYGKDNKDKVENVILDSELNIVTTK